MTEEMLLIVHCNGGWCVVLADPEFGHQIVSGPHRDHADAVQAAETRALRVKQGWTP